MKAAEARADAERSERAAVEARKKEDESIRESELRKAKLEEAIKALEKTQQEAAMYRAKMWQN